MNESKVRDASAGDTDALDGVRRTLSLIDQSSQQSSVVSVNCTCPLLVLQCWYTEVSLELYVKVWKSRDLANWQTRIFGGGISIQGCRLLRAFVHADLADTLGKEWLRDLSLSMSCSWKTLKKVSKTCGVGHPLTRDDMEAQTRRFWKKRRGLSAFSPWPQI